MEQVILIKDISQTKMEALLNFLRSCDIEAEVKSELEVSAKKKSEFSLSVGLWKDRSIDANELRDQAWTRSI